MTVLETPRLRLRSWRPTDREPFAAMNGDPEVMRFFVKPLTRAETDEFVDRILEGFARRGFGWWAVEVPGVIEFAGFIGLSVPSFTTPFTPCTEVGWRLARSCWGRGYATEGARAALDYAFGHLNLADVVAFTVPGNLASRRVMDKVGMTQDLAGTFEHPLIPVGHPLRTHVLYRIAAGAFR